MARTPKKKRTFHQELVLNRWMLSHFHGDGLRTLKDRLGDDRHEGIDDDGQTRFFHELTRNLFNMDRVSAAELRRYDLHIVAHWQKITHRRNATTGAVLTMKYFQYLSLLFAVGRSERRATPCGRGTRARQSFVFPQAHVAHESWPHSRRSRTNRFPDPGCRPDGRHLFPASIR